MSIWAPLITIALQCVSNPPTTSFILKSEKDKVNFRMIHHYGWGYAPISSGLVVPNDLVNLAKQAELLKKLPDDLEMVFDAKNCTIYSDGTFRCFSIEETKHGGEKIRWRAVHSQKITQNLFGQIFETLRLSFKMDFADHAEWWARTVGVTMDYSKEECRSL